MKYKAYLFELGHQPHISTAEIKAVFSLKKINYKVLNENNNYFIIETNEKLDTLKLINLLGGTVKISERIGQSLASSKQIIDVISSYFADNQPEGKIHFSLSGKEARQLAIKIKQELKKEGRSVRFVEPKNTATILYNKLVEKGSDFAIIENSIFVTRAIQPFEKFGERDYGRPGSDSSSGMLPPKLARILINLSEIKPKEILLDPFCGSGTVLMEAALMGQTNFIGSDISEKAISDTGGNLKWLKTNFDKSDFQYQLLISDVTEVDKLIKKKSINVIATEPFLGRPLKGNETENQLLNQSEDLKKMYINAFKVFYKILKSGGTIIFIIPRFRHHNNWITIDCDDEIKKIGFELIPFSEKEPFLLYWRPKQHVGREIWKFKLSYSS